MTHCIFCDRSDDKYHTPKAGWADAVIRILGKKKYTRMVVCNPPYRVTWPVTVWMR